MAELAHKEITKTKLKLGDFDYVLNRNMHGTTLWQTGLVKQEWKTAVVVQVVHTINSRK